MLVSCTGIRRAEEIAGHIQQQGVPNNDSRWVLISIAFDRTTSGAHASPKDSTPQPNDTWQWQGTVAVWEFPSGCHGLAAFTSPIVRQITGILLTKAQMEP